MHKNNHWIFTNSAVNLRVVKGDKALDLILKTAMKFNVSDDEMPTTLLIISDMQFHEGTSDRYDYGELRSKKTSTKTETEVEKAINRWVKNGYTIPKIIYWNTSAYAGSPAEADTSNIALVSGFSPAILKAIFSGEDFTPESIMLRALEKYKDISIPDKFDEKKRNNLAKLYEKKEPEMENVSKQNLFSNVLKSKKGRR